ncbi:DUF305 domain-containing protein [Streptomyces werraensis]|uniref:DUF305 domain-containing protein n=1 Tax=Streptomyces werraensis TaxID=68284 RepID=UPI0033B3A663
MAALYRRPLRRRMRRSLLAAGGVLAGALVLSACGGDMGGMDMGDGSASSSSDSAASGSTGPMAMPTRARGAFNDADVAYVQGMIAHCEQLVEMADLTPGRAYSEKVKNLASRTKTSEEAEIAAEKSWLRAWGRPESPAMDMGDMEMGDDDSSMTISDAEMKKLMNAKGADFDRAYVEALISHRRMEAGMSDDVQKDGRNATVKEQAAMMAAMQRAEVKELEHLLATL